MKRAYLPIDALPAWCKLNDVTFLDTAVSTLDTTKGYGLLTQRPLSSTDTYDVPTLLIVPHDLVLSAEGIEEYSKVDHHFRQLLDAVGCQPLRINVMLFLLMQITITSPESTHSTGSSNPWTEYVKIIPDNIPVPTLWTEDQRVLLRGTSLESALTAKIAALTREFDELKRMTAELPWCQKSWWVKESLVFSDWMLVDAWYRSRCLELPLSGESMVPALDMANHSSVANAYFEQTSRTSVSLLLKPGNIKLEAGSEVTISYGASKSNAEMLFSYGFIDTENQVSELVLNLEPMPDDPLGKAKLAVFKGPSTLHITEVDGVCKWDGDFIYLECLNEEDGLDFKVLQENDGSHSTLRVFWGGADVTGNESTFKSLVSEHELKDIFELRAVVLVQERIQQQLSRLYENEELILSLANTPVADSTSYVLASRLREKETELLLNILAGTEIQKNDLLQRESVVHFLGLMDMESQNDPPPQIDTNYEEDDFS